MNKAEIPNKRPSISTNGNGNVPAVLDVQEWRDNFQKLIVKFPHDKVLYRELSEIDNYYETRKGGLELYKVKQNLASITKTARAVKALEKWLNTQAPKTKKGERQKVAIPK